MTKQAFTAALQAKLSALPDREEHINFYIEMIEDRMEEGLSEEEAVAAIGSADTVAAQILASTPSESMSKKKERKQLRVWEILLLILGSPIWLSLAIAALAVVLSLYVVLWAGILALWAVFAAAAACVPCGIFLAVLTAINRSVLLCLALIGASFACAGLAIFLFLGCLYATKGIWLLSKIIVRSIARLWTRKEVTE